MSEESADAQTPAVNAETPDGGSETVSRAELEKAIKARDSVKAKYREVEAQLNELKQAQADAERAKAQEEGDLKKQIEFLQADLQSKDSAFAELQSTLQGERRALRTKEIESGLLADVPTESREAVLVMFRGLADSLDDGEAEPDAVVKAASKQLKKMAPALFNPQSSGPSRGFVASNPTPDPIAEERQRVLRGMGIKGLL